ncbi:MAG: RraA family protein [Geminicoccaceae bacterium]
MEQDAIVRRLGAMFTSTLSNALEDIGEDGVISGLTPAGPAMRCAGRAMCVLETTGPAGTFPAEAFKVGEMIDAARPGDVVVVANGGQPVSSWGGTASFAAKQKGIAGLIVDGGVRDREEMIEHAFPVFTRHMVPTTGRTRIQVVEIGGTIEVSGIRVVTGDVIVADGTGIVCIPKDKAGEVADIAEALQADDDQAVAEIAKGLTFTEAMAKFRKI